MTKLKSTNWLDEVFYKFSKETAVNCSNRKYTYTSLNKTLNETAVALYNKGLRKGDRIAIISPNNFMKYLYQSGTT